MPSEPLWAQWKVRRVRAVPFASVVIPGHGRVEVASVGPVWWSVIIGTYAVARSERVQVGTLELLPSCVGIQVEVGGDVYQRARTATMTDQEWKRVVGGWIGRAQQVGGRVDGLERPD